jgi:hypothetical protein
MRRFLLTVATAASALVGTACSDAIGIGGNVAGSYELRTINGQSLPITFNDPDFGSVTFVAGEVELDNDGTFIDTIQFRFSGSSLVETQSVFGTWTRSGSEIRFETDDGDVYFMERTSSNRLVQDDGTGFRLVYERF